MSYSDIPKFGEGSHKWYQEKLHEKNVVIESLKRKISNFEKKNNSLLDDVDDLRDKVDKLEEDKNNLEDDNDELHDKLAKLKEDKVNLEVKLGSIRNSRELNSEEIEELREDKTILEKKNEELKYKISDLKEQLAGNKKLHESNSTLKSQNQKLKEGNDEKVKELQENYRKINEENLMLKNEISKLNRMNEDDENSPAISTTRESSEIIAGNNNACLSSIRKERTEAVRDLQYLRIQASEQSIKLDLQKQKQIEKQQWKSIMSLEDVVEELKDRILELEAKTSSR